VFNNKDSVTNVLVKRNTLLQDNKEHLNKISDKMLSEAKVKSHQIDVKFIGINENFSTLENQKTSYYSSFYNSPNHPNGVLDVPSFNSISYKEIYSGIDINFFTNENGFKYDFVVKPNGEVNKIELEWNGAQHMKLTKDGSLRIKTSLGEVTETIPEAYQIINNEKVKVDARFRLKKTGKKYFVSFETGAYNKDYQLVIDPWITYYGAGGNFYDFSADLKIDDDENVYITGLAYNDLIFATPGAHQTTLAGEADAFIAKFTTDGQRIWGTYIGGAELDQAYGLTLDNQNNIYVVGSTTSITGIATPGSAQPDLLRDSNVFLIPGLPPVFELLSDGF
jgi:hypothetical protein